MYAGSQARLCLNVKTQLVREERRENHWCVWCSASQTTTQAQ